MGIYSIKTKDTVEVITGKDKGKRGKIIRLILPIDKVVVEKLNVAKRHIKPSNKHPHGGIIEKELPLPISNVMLVCPKCSKRTRIGKKFLEDGVKVRLCKKCGEVIDK
ncbi:MAG TPA: 50S ribosomal protein L24 [bacterium]